jgi:hypothetical protein
VPATLSSAHTWQPQEAENVDFDELVNLFDIVKILRDSTAAA